MKTAMQELIDKLHPNFFTEHEKTLYLEKEKQQIIEAYDLGMGHYGDANCRTDAEKYYKETYK